MTDVLNSSKNFDLSPAAQSLGLGDQLNQQLEDQLAQRRKQAQGGALAAGPGGLTGNVISDLLGAPSLGGFGGGNGL